MRKTSKFVVTIALILVATVLAGTAVFAADYDAQADTLHELGLFQGTNEGYALDQTSTRAQAAVMLVRMLGKEAEVQAGAYTDPFTDVPAWAANYIGYMYENGLTNGTSDTTFGSDENCSAQMFTVFVLRALGYSEETGDFSYAQAQEFAAELGLPAADASDVFLRDDMVALSYAALFQNTKETETPLLEELAANNAVDAEIADKYLDYYAVYQSYLADSAKTNQTQSLRMSADSTISLTANDVVQQITQKTESSIVFKDNDLVMKQSTVMDYAGSVIETTSYFSDGWLYVETAEGKYKYEYPLDINALIQQSGMNQTVEPFYLISSIEKTATATGVRYTIAYSATAMNELMGSMLSDYAALTAGADIRYNALTIAVDFDAAKNIKSVTTTADLTVAVTAAEEQVVMDMTLESVSKILETGNSVTVTLPSDLADYVETALPQS